MKKVLLVLLVLFVALFTFGVIAEESVESSANAEQRPRPQRPSNCKFVKIYETSSYQTKAYYLNTCHIVAIEVSNPIGNGGSVYLAYNVDTNYRGVQINRLDMRRDEFPKLLAAMGLEENNSASSWND